MDVQIFISCSVTETGPEALLIQERLQQLGYNTFVPDGKTEATSNIAHALANAPVVIVLCSSGYGKDVSASGQLHVAASLQKHVVPVWHSGRYPPEGVPLLTTESQRHPVPRSAPLVECGVSAVELVVSELCDRLDALGVYPASWTRALAATQHQQQQEGATLPRTNSPPVSAFLSSAHALGVLDSEAATAGGASPGKPGPGGCWPSLPVGRPPSEQDLRPLMQELKLTSSGELRFRRMLEGHSRSHLSEGGSSPMQQHLQEQAQAQGHQAVPSPQPTSDAPAASQAPSSSGGSGTGGKPRLGSPRSMLSASFKLQGQGSVSKGRDGACRPPVTQADMVHTFEGHTSGLRALAVSPDSSTLYSAGEDKVLKVWSVGAAGFQLLHSIPEAHAGWIWALTLTWDGAILFSGAGDKAIKMWALSPGSSREPPRLVHSVLGHTDAVCSFAVSRDNARLYSGSDDSTIRIWDISGGVSVVPPMLAVLEGHQGYIASLALSADGALLVSGSMDQTIKTWRVGEATADVRAGFKCSTGSPALPGSPKVAEGVTWSSAAASGAKGHVAPAAPPSLTPAPPPATTQTTAGPPAVAAAAGGGTLPVGGLSAAVAAHQQALAASASAGHLARLAAAATSTSSGNLARLASPSGGGAEASSSSAGMFQLLHTMTAHTLGVYTAALSPDSRFMYSGGGDKTIRVWSMDPRRGAAKLLHTLEGHGRWVRSVRLTPDGAVLVSASADATICLWNVANPQAAPSLIQALQGHTDRVRCVRVSPDGRQLFSASADSTIRCWALS